MRRSTCRAELGGKRLWPPPEPAREMTLQLVELPGLLACISEQIVDILGEVLGVQTRRDSLACWSAAWSRFDDCSPRSGASIRQC